MTYNFVEAQHIEKIQSGVKYRLMINRDYNDFLGKQEI